MDELFSIMDDSKRAFFDKNYIDELYIGYMEKNDVQQNHLTELKKKI